MNLLHMGINGLCRTYFYGSTNITINFFEEIMIKFGCPPDLSVINFVICPFRIA